MRALTLDKIASVTLNCGIRRDVRLSEEFPCEEGDIVAVRVVSSKATYNTVELTSGRMSALKAGDVLAGALGHRNALQGYSGRIPARLQPGDPINILNLGGVLGECVSCSPTVGPAFECEVLGQVLAFPEIASRRGVPANIAQNAGPLDERLLASGAPVVAVAGTCMNSGKTEACIASIREFSRMGMRVAAGKATGVSLRRDVLAMEDAGAAQTLIFTDLGVVTTQPSNAASIARTMLNRLARYSPNVIVLELGDGLMGSYGVDAIFRDPALANAFDSIVLAANDPVGAWGGATLLRDRYGLEPRIVTGPATDNLAGTGAIEDATGLPALNARVHGAELGRALLGALGVVHA